MDLDGTLYPERTEKRVSAALARRLYDYASGIGIQEDDLLKLVGRYVREWRITPSIDIMCGKYSLDREEVARYVFDADPKLFGIREDRKLRLLLLKVSASNMITLFTNSPWIWADRAIGAMGLSDVFGRRNTICYETLDHGASTKPSERSFEILMKRTTTDRSRLLLLDDDLWNVRVAKLMGINTLRIFDKKAGRKTKRRDIHSALEKLSKSGPV